MTDAAAAYRLLETLRWGDTPRCPHCTGRPGGAGGTRPAGPVSYLLRPADGRTRRTRSGGVTARRVWKCATCRRQFSVLSGTLLQGTRVDLPTWIRVLSAVAAAGRVPDAAALAREHALSRAAARRVVALLDGASGADPEVARCLGIDAGTGRDGGSARG